MCIFTNHLFYILQRQQLDELHSNAFVETMRLSRTVAVESMNEQQKELLAVDKI